MRQRSRGSFPASRRVFAGTVLTATMLLPATAAIAETTTALPGGSNVQSAIAYSQATFSDGSAPTALLARDDDFSDALTSGSVQGLLDAPLLLTNSEVISPETIVELDRLGAQEVIIMGGTEAVSTPAEEMLIAAGYETSRLSGETRIETAVVVAQTLFPNATTVVVARAFGTPEDPTQDFADSIAAGNYSASTMTPVLLTDTGELSGPTLAHLQASAVESALIAGGPLAVSANTEAQLAAIDVSAKGNAEDPRTEEPDTATFTVTRAAGATRGGTATALNAELGFATAADADRVLLIEGYTPDAWASGLTAGAQAKNGTATVLSDGEVLFDATTNFLGSGANRPLVCGPNVTTAACDAANSALGNERAS